MDKGKMKKLFRQAEEELDEARKELYKPEEDVVKYAVCVSARKALVRFLNCLYMLYTHENGDEAKEEQSMEQLIAYCSKYDKELEALDFSSVFCREKGSLDEEDQMFYCNNVYKVKFCTELADNVRELVLNKAGAGFGAHP